MDDQQEAEILQALFPGLREANWGPFPLEGYGMWTDIMGGVVRMPLRFNGQRVTLEMHPDHAAMLGRALLDAAVLQWQAWNLTTRARQ